jgi:FMN reductase
LHQVGARLALAGHRARHLHVRALPAHALLHAELDDPVLADALAMVAEADALAIATPVYKAACSGMLKAFSICCRRTA